MKKLRKPVAAPVDASLSRYDAESAFPHKLALAKKMLAKTNLAKLAELARHPAKA